MPEQSTPTETEQPTPWRNPGKWNVSPWNFLPEVEAQRELPPGRKVFVTDGTIRALCTSEPGAVIQVGDTVEIARTLVEMGVVEIRLAVGQDPLSVEIAQAIKRAGLEVPLSGAVSIYPETHEAQLAANEAAGVDHVELEYGPLDPREGFDYTEAAYAAAESLAERTLAAGRKFVFGFNIAPDTNFDYMMGFYRRLLKYTPPFYRIYDPYVCCGPEAMAWLVRTIRRELGADCPPLVLHTHNIWGNGSAINTAAVQAGLAGLDIVANCLGAKAGHADFAATVMALECLYDVRTGIKTELLTQLAEQTERALGIPLHINTPFVGKRIFMGEKKFLAVRALLDQAGAATDFTPYSSKMVGGKKRAVWGKGGISYLIKPKLGLMGIEATDEQVQAIKEALFARVDQLTSYPLWIEDDEAEQIIRTTLEKTTPAVAGAGR